MKTLAGRNTPFSFPIALFFASLALIPVILLIRGIYSSDAQYGELQNIQTLSQLKEAEAFYSEGSKESRALILKMPATKYIRLTGSNLPENLEKLNDFVINVCAGQYESLSFLIHGKEDLNDIRLSWGNFNAKRDHIEASAMDAYIAKVWYQAGIKSSDVKNKLLTQELLVKNDALVRTDLQSQTNYLWVTDRFGDSRYTDISTPDAQFPEHVTVKDSETLLPFQVAAHTNKQIWLTIHVPERSRPGKYSGTLRISDKKGELKQVTLEINVLPFSLDDSRLIYSLYYHGALRNWTLRQFHCEDKTPEQLEIELRDMKEHGVLYPNNYQDIKRLPENLSIREKAGLPKDFLFSTLLDWCSAQPATESGLKKFRDRVEEYKKVSDKYGYRQLYIYGIDEARGEKLKAQRPLWNAAHSMGVKIFVAGYYDTYDDMGDILDAAVIQGPLKPDLSEKYHSKGNRIFSYSNPQVGQENPEIYRRNFGFALWKSGYDGAMNYAYQKNYGSIWNDFDNPRYREETFTYPVSNGIISTIQWEGFRQGINDVRYISTLLNSIDRMRNSGKDVSSYENWIKRLDISGDPDEVRQQVIDKILSIKKTGV